MLPVAEKAMKIAADADIYTNHMFTWEVLDIKKIQEEEAKKEKELENEAKRQPKTSRGRT